MPTRVALVHTTPPSPRFTISERSGWSEYGYRLTNAAWRFKIFIVMAQQFGACEMQNRNQLCAGFALLFAIVAAPTLAQAQQTAALTPPAVVSTCEVNPDGTNGNCPPTVDSHYQALGLTGSALTGDIAATAAVLAQRAQKAESDGDLPLCIDLSRGILQTSTYSTDTQQQSAIAELAKLMCCVPVLGVKDGIYYGTTTEVRLSGILTDGVVARGTFVFSSAGATFVADGVKAGDVVVIDTGRSQGYYLIEAVNDNHTLVVQQDVSTKFAGFPANEQNLTYQIRRREPQYAQTTCTPGFSTAAIPIVPTPLASPQ